MKRLNSHGVAHDVLALAIVAIVAIVGVGYLVASHAETPSNNSNTSSIPGLTYLGQKSLPKQKEVIKVYGCKLSIGSNIWDVYGYFTLSRSFKVENMWQAFVINTGKQPYPGYQSASAYFNNGTFNAGQPYIGVDIKVYSNVNNYLTFQYSYGPSVKGQVDVGGKVVKNVRPSRLTTCTK